MLDKAAQLALLGALEELRSGTSRRFEDRLWLGFGDDWTRIRGLLVKDAAIREVPGDAPTFVMLPRGDALRMRLSEALAPKSASSMTAINVAIVEGAAG